jgi:two-component system copper resistance phosphate regulon response regulator CusR
MRRILAIDDDPDNLELIGKILTHAGYHFTGAQTGTDGIHLAINQTFDLIILDIDLPDVQGDEVARRLKAHSSTPILSLTGNDELGDRERYLDAGCDGYLPKPISRPYLLAAIAELL